MKKILLTLFLLLATVSTTFAMTYDEAKMQDKPIVVMFHMHGCGACRQFSPVFDKFASKFSDKFNFVKEDIKNSAIADKLGSSFSTVPAIFIIHPKTEKPTRIKDSCAWNDECFTKTLQTY